MKKLLTIEGENAVMVGYFGTVSFPSFPHKELIREI